MIEFEVHHQLLDDCFVLGDAEFCRVLLMNDARFPWLILVPRITGLRDIHEVPPNRRLILFDEIEAASKALSALVATDKVNVAALGNQVPQLHIHVISRSTTDAAWPGPVWGSGDLIPYDSDVRFARSDAVVKAMSLKVIN